MSLASRRILLIFNPVLLSSEPEKKLHQLTIGTYPEDDYKKEDRGTIPLLLGCEKDRTQRCSLSDVQLTWCFLSS